MKWPFCFTVQQIQELEATLYNALQQDKVIATLTCSFCLK